MPRKYKSDLTILSVNRIGTDFFEMTINADKDGVEIRPGQFVEIKVNGADGVLLRRPISIHDYDSQSKTMSLLVHIVGNGTRQLAMLREDDKLDVVFPLGNGFDLAAAGARPLLVGGGVGVAPLFLLAKELKKCGADPVFLLGAKTASGLIKRGDYEGVCRVDIATEDGSEGIKGFVTNHPDLASEQIKGFTSILQCGPTPMMKAVAAKAKEAGVECFASLENMMACGFGVCLCCVTDTVNGMKRVCADGPVFNVNDLKW
ncbi:MAG: dihydroorotate dehydrogenase electron transfer subunit [Marinilabiliaceae bacterium]